MMDRNTITALLLITVVLVLTPYYIDLVSPSSPEQELYDQDPQNDELGEQSEVSSIIYTHTPTLEINKDPQDEKIIKIDTDLYEAKISSVGGGSIISYKIKEHLSPDSSFVNLISKQNKENLMVRFKNMDGEDIVLGGAWVQENKLDSAYITDPQTITYTKTLGANLVTKTITLYPDNFIIDIDVDLAGATNNVLGNTFSIGWGGGLPTTEKDSVVDKTYFGAFLYQGGELLDVKAGTNESFKNEYKGQTDWAAIRTKYFVVAILENGSNRISAATVSASNTTQELYDISVNLSSLETANLSLYLGPLEYDRIKSLRVNLESIMDFGWLFIRPIAKGVLWALKSMNVYIPNYGIVLIVFSVLVKALVYPLTKKSYQSTQAMQAIQPEITILKEKYKKNPTKLNQETMGLYKKKGVNPLGSCLPMMLQMPLLFALFTVFRSTIELRGEPFVFWIKDLSAPDVIFYLPFKIPIYGDYVCALPILMAVSMYLQQKLMSPGGAQQEQQKIMQYFMMVFFFLLFNSFPSGLNLYYTLFNVLSIAQQKLGGTKKEAVATPVS